MENKAPLNLVVPEHILKPLLVSGNSVNLEQALENLIETAKTPDGRLHLASVNFLPIVLESLNLSLKLLQNLCAAEILNQNCFIEEDGVDVVARAFDSISFRTNSDDEIFEIIRFGLELLSNVCEAGEEHQAAVWFRLFPVVFKDIAGIQDKTTSDLLSMVICFCCNGSKDLMRQLCEVQGLQIVAEIVRTASRVDTGEDRLFWLLEKICLEESSLLPLFFSFTKAGALEKNDHLKETNDIFTHENEFLLSSLARALPCLVINSIYPRKSVVEVGDFFRRGQSKLPTGTLAVDILRYSINLLRKICKQDSSNIRIEESGTIINSLLSSGLLDLLIGLLRKLGPPSIIKKSIPLENTSMPLKVGPYKGFRRDIVAVIAICLHGAKHVQDEIRQKDAILLLVQQCVTDEDNELLRECGIWALRNLLVGNEENQKIVAKLVIQGSADVPELDELGFRLVLDPYTQRAKLVNIRPD
ncbi:hypothetical protein MKX01_033838 [Papaver californicum]|nr:hypothetical protein MKX01_033838 [Papaver californicum]